MCRVFAPIKNYVLNFLQTQLVVTIASVPILIGWGLSISLMTFVGNLLFAPVLTIFLVLSSLVFFTQLLHIPNEWLIGALDRFTLCWDAVLAYGSPGWLIEFRRLPTLVLVATPVFMIIVLSWAKMRTATARLFVLGAFFVGSLLGVWLYSARVTESVVCAVNPQGVKMIAGRTIFLAPDGSTALSSVPHGLDICQHPDGSLTIEDDGFFCRRPSPEKAVEFELKPYLVKNFGKIRLKEFEVKRPGMRNFKTALACCTFFPVACVVIPASFIEAKLTPGGLEAYHALSRFLDVHGIVLKRKG